MLYGVASSRDAAGADRFATRFGVRGAGGLLPASSAARGGADVGAPCHPSRDRVILLSILTYTFCVRLCVPDTRARRPRRSKDAAVHARRAACADTRGRGPPGPRSRPDRIADWDSRGWREFPPGARTRSGAIRFSSGVPEAGERPGYAPAEVT